MEDKNIKKKKNREREETKEEKRKERRRRGYLRNLMSIGPSNRS